jgi:hypothetical protein
LANDIRKALSEFYEALKAAGNWRGHVFVTGVSRFAKTSIFSALNNLEDLTLAPKFADICALSASEFDILPEERQGRALGVAQSQRTDGSA